VFRVDLPNIENIERARQTRHLPVVLTREEIKTLLSHIEGIEHFDNFLLCCESSRLERISNQRVIDFDRAFHRCFWGEFYRSRFHPIVIVLLNQ
jgi:integrase